jgi:hypothetical protein
MSTGGKRSATVPDGSQFQASGGHPVTLFTGQWTDLPFEQVAGFASECGYDGLEIAVSGDHLDVWRAAAMLF